VANGKQATFVMKGDYTFWQAYLACIRAGGDLPKRAASSQKANKSYSQAGCTGAFQSPQMLRRENFYR